MDSNLYTRFHKFRDSVGVPVSKIAELTGIEPHKLYRFSSGQGDLRNDDAVALHIYLKSGTPRLENMTLAELDEAYQKGKINP